MKLKSKYLRIVLIIALALLLGFFIGSPESSFYEPDENFNPNQNEDFHEETEDPIEEPECDGDNPCPDGEFCTWAGKCRVEECRSSLDCPDPPQPHICVDNVCSKCEGFDDCERDEFCNDVKGECEEGDCQDSDDCSCSAACIGNQCIEEDDNEEGYCNSLRSQRCVHDCPEEDETCKSNNRCADIDDCFEDKDCGGRKVCEDGSCVPGDYECKENDDCSNDEYCDGRNCEKGCWERGQCSGVAECCPDHTCRDDCDDSGDGDYEDLVHF